MESTRGITNTFHHVALYTPKYDEAVRFYESLGFMRYVEWIEKEQPCCFIDMGNGPMLEFHGDPGAAPVAENMHICIHTNDVDTLYALALDNGAEPYLLEPADCPLTCANGDAIQARLAFLRAPAGEIVEIINWKGYSQEGYKSFLSK